MDVLVVRSIVAGALVFSVFLSGITMGLGLIQLGFVAISVARELEPRPPHSDQFGPLLGRWAGGVFVLATGFTLALAIVVFLLIILILSTLR